ncbi:HDOD domain-containing protein [Oxalobacteraceae sp. CFBP 8753]|nr:HDOD domain-containing protein [Oxalobacteraceae sp. CFBP 8753]
MKNWIGRLLGSAEKETIAPAPVSATLTFDDDQAIATEVQATYYRWLTASSRCKASPEQEAQILREVRSLAADPVCAAGLVPRIPELIAQLLTSLSDENISTGALSAQVGRDLVLVAEVIREANSAYYRPVTPIETLEGAVTMLGLNGLRMLLARIAFRPLLRVTVQGVARQVAPIVWKHAERCAFAASVMAPGLSAGVFEAYLSGLMQNLGLQVAFQVADRVCQGKVPGSGEFGIAFFAAGRELSSVIASHWDFPPDVVKAIAQAHEAEGSHPAQALALGDRIATLRLLLDAGVIGDDDPLVMQGLNGFERRCLGKLLELSE